MPVTRLSSGNPWATRKRTVCGITASVGLPGRPDRSSYIRPAGSGSSFPSIAHRRHSCRPAEENTRFLAPFVIASSALAKPSRATASLPSVRLRSAFKVTKTGLSSRGLGWAADWGRSTLVSTVAKGRRDHEDDQQHQHDIDEGGDVDLAVFLEIAAFVSETRRHVSGSSPGRLGGGCRAAARQTQIEIAAQKALHCR